jgi:hypothetical protein
MNPKARAIFAHILVDATFIYLFYMDRKTHEIKNNNCGILGNVQIIYYGCCEATLNGSFHIHVLLWNANAPNPNKLKCATIER